MKRETGYYWFRRWNDRHWQKGYYSAYSDEWRINDGLTRVNDLHAEINETRILNPDEK